VGEIVWFGFGAGKDNITWGGGRGLRDWFMVNEFSYSDGVLRNGVSWSQSGVFRFLKMWYDDSTVRLDRFWNIALKLTLGLQNLCSFFRFALFDISS